MEKFRSQALFTIWALRLSFQPVQPSEEDGKNVDTVLEKFNTYFVPQVNVIHERATFHKRSQSEGESVEYIRSLSEFSEHAQFA